VLYDVGVNPIIHSVTLRDTVLVLRRSRGTVSTQLTFGSHVYFPMHLPLAYCVAPAYYLFGVFDPLRYEIVHPPVGPDEPGFTVSPLSVS